MASSLESINICLEPDRARLASLGSAELPHVHAHERRLSHAGIMRAAHPLPPLRRGRLG
jgi:hypothetical protein